MSSIEKAMKRQRDATVDVSETPIENKSDVTKPDDIEVKSSGSFEVETATKSVEEQKPKEGLPNEDFSSSSPSLTFEIDLESLEERGFVALSKKRTVINEEFRNIKRKILNNAFGPISKTINNSNLILVSSSRANEGKTFSAVNLALSLALEKDKTVLLVDADVLKPSVSKTLGLGTNMGLIEYLTGEIENVSSVIYKTNIENLRVIPAGLPHHLSNELLSSDKMRQLTVEFATRYPDRIVIFDCPPLLGVNETTVMAEQCGQGILVVEESKTKVRDIKKAIDLLPKEMAAGLLMNKQTELSDTQSYGYYYGASN